MTCKNKSFMTKKKAFTLIELLIVIAIIGILFIVLVSKVDFATDKAKTTGVQTDFRSFQVAIESVAKENAGLATFGWDTGDTNGNHVRDSYDKGDTNQNGKQDPGEIFVGSKTYSEICTGIYTLTNPADANDMSAIAALEAAINANLDPKLHIRINNDLTITMANGAQDPWNTEYHGYYITNATVDNKDRGAIVIYSNGANQEFGSEHSITGGVVTVTVPGNNVYGKDDYSIAVVYTYASGYGETSIVTYGFSNNHTVLQSGNQSQIETNIPDDENVIMLNGDTLYIRGSNETLIFRSSANYCDFSFIKIDNVVVDRSNYDVSEGSTIIELKNSYLETLIDGEHTIEVHSINGYASAVFICKTEKHIVPEGGKYYSALGKTYYPGDEMPDEVMMGDAFYYGDYIYRYNQRWYSNGASGYSNYPDQNGWCAFYNTSKNSPGKLESYINGKPLTSLYLTFWLRDNIVSAPEIPDTVICLNKTFEGCTSLTEAPVIPSSVKSMEYTFSRTSIYIAPILPEGLESMSHTFDRCYNLTTVYNIPSTVTYMWRTFYQCKSLTDLRHLTIPKSVTSTQELFWECTSLTHAPKLEDGLTGISSAFGYCTSLTDEGMPILPDSIKGITQAFVGCTSLVDLSNYVIPEKCLYTNAVFSDCTSLKYAPVLNGLSYFKENDVHYYRYFSGLFKNCTSLTGTVYINVSSQFYDDMFAGVDFQKQNLRLGGSNPSDTAGFSGINYCRVCKGKHYDANEPHTCHGGTATCVSKAVCDSCNLEYGEIGFIHNSVNGYCVWCNRACTLIETDHYPYASQQTDSLIGSWDFSNAKSVEIVILYQTYTSSYDYLCLNFEDRYVNYNGTLTTNKYKFGGDDHTVRAIHLQSVDMLTGIALFTSDNYQNNYYGFTIMILPNY